MSSAVPLSPISPHPARPPSLPPASSPSTRHAPTAGVSDQLRALRTQTLDSLADRLPPRLIDFAANNVGLLLVFGAQLFFGLMNVTVKYLMSSADITVLTIISVRMSISALSCVLALTLQGDPHPFLGPPDVRHLLAARGLFGSVGLVCSYQSFRGLSVSDSVTIQYLTPSLTAILGFLVLGEMLKSREVIATVFCLVGVVFVSRPHFIFGGRDTTVTPPPDDMPLPNEGEVPYVPSREVSLAFAMGAVVASSCAYIVIRKLGKGVTPFHALAYYGYTCAIGSVIGLILGVGSFSSMDKHSFWLIMAIGVFGFFAQVLVTMGLQREKAGRAMLATYTSVFWTIGFELVLFHTLPAPFSVLGIAIILGSGYWVAQSANRPSSAVDDDVESQPISRSPSPIPGLGRPTLRGEHYSYDAAPTKDVDEEESLANGGKKVNGGLRPAPMLARRSSRSSGSGVAK